MSYDMMPGPEETPDEPAAEPIEQQAARQVFSGRESDSVSRSQLDIERDAEGSPALQPTRPETRDAMSGHLSGPETELDSPRVVEIDVSGPGVEVFAKNPTKGYNLPDMTSHEGPHDLARAADNLLFETSHQAPVLEAGPVVITHLSGSESGFDIESARSLGRTEGVGGPLVLEADLRDRLGAAYQGAQKFNAIQDARHAKHELQNAIAAGSSSDEIERLQNEFENASAIRRRAPQGGEIGFNGGDLLNYARSVVRYSTAAVNARDKLSSGNFEEGETRESVQAQLDSARAAWSSALTSGAEQFQDATFVTDARKVLEAFDQGQDVPTEKLAEYRSALDGLRKAYVGRGKKIGIRNVTVDGDVVTADVKSVPFPVYIELAKPGHSDEVLDLSRLVGAAMILQTADEQPRLLVQHRAVSVQRLNEPKMTRGNASYTDIPGASVAGVVDASMRNSPLRQPGTPDRIDTDTIKSLIYKEAGEELGLGPEHLHDVIIAGIGQDRVKPHDEFLLLGKTNLTAAQVNEVSRKSNRNKNLGDADFEEKYLDIEASPAAIATLLTQVRCPLPPTHAAALVAAGYSLELQSNGIEVANLWRDQVEIGIRENYTAMDDIVRAYYAEYPEALNQVPERFLDKRPPKRDPEEGYNPSLAPIEQGLPELQDELVRVGLANETRIIVDEAELFDVDGVITDPFEKQADGRIVSYLTERLQSGVPIELNTGRSTEWVDQRVMPLLRERIGDISLLHNLLLVGEKAGTWTCRDGLGNEISGQSKALTVPSDLQAEVERIVSEEFSHIMHVDPTKRTMISIEINDGMTDRKEEFAAAQQILVTKLTDALKNTGRQHQYIVDATTIATDIQSPYVGKDMGAIRFLQWLSDRGIKARRFVTFGDSASDAEMAMELQRRGNTDVTFVYVGPPGKLEGVKLPNNVVQFPGFNEGTVRYIESQVA